MADSLVGNLTQALKGLLKADAPNSACQGGLATLGAVELGPVEIITSRQSASRVVGYQKLLM